MENVLSGIPLIGLSAPALVSIAVLLLLTGKIVPRATYVEKKEEALRWQAAYEKEREARAKSNDQTVEMLAALKTNHSVIVAMFETIKSTTTSGGH